MFDESFPQSDGKYCSATAPLVLYTCIVEITTVSRLFKTINFSLDNIAERMKKATENTKPMKERHLTQ